MSFNASRDNVLKMVDETWKEVDQKAFDLTEELKSYGYERGRAKVTIAVTVEVEGTPIKRETTYSSGIR